MQNLDKLKELAEKLPKEVKDNALALVARMGETIEGIGDTPIEWRPELLKVVQPSSDRSKLPKGSNIGSMILGESIVGQPLEVIPFRLWKARQYWSPDKDETRMICWSPDAVMGKIGKQCKDCEFGKFNQETNRSECNKVISVISITADLSSIFTVNFAKTNYQSGMDWEKLMRKAGVKTTRKIYELRTETSKKYKNVESLIVDTQNKATPASYMPFLDELFERIGQDREEHKRRFYEIVRAGASDNLLASPRDAGGDDIDVLPVQVAESTGTQAELAKKYSM